MTPTLFAPREVAPGVTLLPACIPVPQMGVLPVNAFVVEDREPMLVDTGVAALAGDFMAALAGVIDPARLRWIWLTHMDADHIGALPAVLEAAPQARLVTNFLGAGKLGLLGLPAERAHLLGDGETLRLGARTVTAVRPPWFDAPETMGLADVDAGVLFSSDAFGAVLDRPFDAADRIAPAGLEAGMRAWAAVDTPWLGDLDADRFETALERVRRLAPYTVLSSHLPPAVGMTERLLQTALLTQRRCAAPLATAA